MKIKNAFALGILDTDSDVRFMRNGTLRHGKNITITQSEGSDAGVVQNVQGNKQLTAFNLGDDVVCIGGFCDEARDKIYWWVKVNDVGSEGCYLFEWDNYFQTASIVLHDTRAAGERVLDLNENFLITGVEKIISEDSTKDLLIWTDDNMEPCCINIERAKTYGENGFEIEDIYLIKKPPVSSPTIQLLYTDGQENFLEDQFLSFSYRYKYLDGEYSALSDYTNYNFTPGQFNLNYQTVENMGMVNLFNALRIGFNTGEKRVTDIQIIVKKSNSSALYIVENFNKSTEGWEDNEVKNFTFSNNKVYQILPEKEIFRAFDNVPLKAKALTLIGNRVVFGNYVEGFDMVDANGVKVKPDYQLDLISNSLTGSDIPLVASEGGFTIDLTGIELNEGGRISLTLSANVDFDGGADNMYVAGYTGIFDFLLIRDYTDVADLVSSDEFIYYVQTVMTDLFLANHIQTEQPDNSEVTWTLFSFSTAGNVISFVWPVPTFTIDTTSGIPDDDNFTDESHLWTVIDDSSAIFRKIGVASSLKTNRSYEIGIEYRDDFNRTTTVLTGGDNTIYIPQEFSTSQNKIKVTLHNSPPSFATNYKVVIKQNALIYHTVYAVLFYEDGPYRWIRLDGANKDKVREGDTLIVKADLAGVRTDLFKVRVIEVKLQETNFISLNADSNDDEIIEEPGLYFKIRNSGIAMETQDSNYAIFVGQSAANPDNDGFPPGNYYDPDWNGTVFLGEPEGTLYGYFDSDSGLYVDKFIPVGTRITLKLSFEFASHGNYTHIIEVPLISSANYDSMEDWFATEFTGLGPEADSYELLMFRHANNALFLRIRSELNFGWLNAELTIQATEGLVIFETDPIITDQEIFYQCEQRFAITNGNHQGNLQNQDVTASEPAIIELEAFNCYVMGNGAESYRIKDVVNNNYLAMDLRPSATSIEPYKQVRRYADMTYSQPYVESGGKNGTNEFNPGDAPFKELDKQYGSIQKLFSRENDVAVFQEEKTSQVLFEKDALTNADGTENLTSVEYVLGQQKTYWGENGIGKHPESAAINDKRVFYVNDRRGIVQRLSNDGVTDIVTGMKDYFRDTLSQRKNAKMLGCWDPHLRQYVVSIGDEPAQNFYAPCGSHLFKVNQTEPYTYYLQLNDLEGEIDFSYNITQGTVEIETEFNGNVEVHPDLSGSGNIVIVRDSMEENLVRVTITPSDAATYEIINNCPIGSVLEIIFVVVGDLSIVGQTMNNRHRWSESSFFGVQDLFANTLITRFASETGLSGQGKFPSSGSTVYMQALKDNTSTGNFILDTNGMAYLVSADEYTESEINDLLDDATYLEDLTQTTGLTTATDGSFEFVRTNPDQKLYLIWDYRDCNSLVDDAITMIQGQTQTIQVSSNDLSDTAGTLSIVTPPANGVATVDGNAIIYESNGSLPDTFVYGSSSACNTATVTINPKPNCLCFVGGSFKGTGNAPVTFGYTDCFGDYVEYTMTLPLNPEPGNNFDFTLTDTVCVTEGTVVKVSGAGVMFTFEYADYCTPQYTLMQSGENFTATSNCDGAGVTEFPVNIFRDKDDEIEIGTILYYDVMLDNPIDDTAGNWVHLFLDLSVKLDATGAITEMDNSCAIDPEGP